MLWNRCFPVNFAKLLRIPLLQNRSGWLLLLIKTYISSCKIFQFRLQHGGFSSLATFAFFNKHYAINILFLVEYIVLNKAFYNNYHDFVLYKDIKGSFKNFYTKIISHVNLSQCKHPVKTFQVLRILCVSHTVFQNYASHT